MKKTKISLADIADQLQVSKTTVSFILNGKAKEKGISDNLVKKVENLAKELNYEPNQFARSLRTGKTNIIGLLVEDISNSFFASIAKNIESIAHKNGYRIIYCSTENSDQRAKGFLRMFWNLGVDGCIVTPTIGLEKEIAEYSRKGMKIILFDRFFSNVPTDYVVINNVNGTYEGTMHLIECGYKNIAFVNIDLKLSQMTDREKGYELAMKESNLEPRAYSFKFQASKDYTRELIDLFKKNKDIDAVLFATNYIGVSGLEAFSRLKLKIPDDIAVLAFDDSEIFRIFSPSITAISQPITELSEVVIETLLERITSPSSRKAEKGIVLNTSLILRESTRNIKDSK